MPSRLASLCRNIRPVDESLRSQAQARLDELTKPKDSLGRLEDLAMRLYCIQNGVTPLRVDPAIMYTAAGDHGVAAENVSPFPQAVTRQMVLNFLHGGAAVNVLCNTANMDLKVVDAGCVGGPFAPHPRLIDMRLGEGTANIVHGPAMDRETCLAALLGGAELAAQSAAAGYGCLGVGEMGISNTTSATALFCAYLNLEPARTVGPGAGSGPEIIRRKTQAIRAALAANAGALEDPLSCLAALGGFEIAVMAGVILGGARAGLPVLVDGFISTAAFAAARALCPDAGGYCVLSHSSAEPGFASVTEALGQEPLLHMGMRLGEGTGAALALPLLRAAAAIFNDMATFAQAGVSGAACRP